MEILNALLCYCCSAAAADTGAVLEQKCVAMNCYTWFITEPLKLHGSLSCVSILRLSSEDLNSREQFADDDSERQQPIGAISSADDHVDKVIGILNNFIFGITLYGVRQVLSKLKEKCLGILVD